MTDNKGSMMTRAFKEEPVGRTVILGGARTPFGKLNGALSSLTAVTVTTTPVIGTTAIVELDEPDCSVRPV